MNKIVVYIVKKTNPKYQKITPQKNKKNQS
jgi:hypothetical protein